MRSRRAVSTWSLCWDELGSKPLGDLCRLVNGKAFKTDDWSDSGHPIIRIQNLNDATKPFNYWDGSLEKQVEVNTGELLIAWSGTPGTSLARTFGKGQLEF